MESAHPYGGVPALLLGPATLNREAVAPSKSGTGGWLPIGPALVPVGAVWLLTKLPAICCLLSVRPSAVPDVFRRRLLLAALSPNAP